RRAAAANHCRPDVPLPPAGNHGSGHRPRGWPMNETGVEISKKGMTPKEAARFLRVSRSKILAWIKRGELHAVNIAAALCGKPRYVVLPHHLAEFEQRRRAAPAPKAKRRRRAPTARDYYPDG